MHNDIACKGHGEVVAQSLFANFQSRLVGIGRQRTSGREEIARVEDLKEELVALVAILAKEGGEVLHGRGLDGLIAIATEDATDGVENVVAARHFGRTEVSRAFGY